MEATSLSWSGLKRWELQGFGIRAHLVLRYILASLIHSLLHSRDGFGFQKFGHFVGTWITNCFIELLIDSCRIRANSKIRFQFDFVSILNIIWISILFPRDFSTMTGRRDRALDVLIFTRLNSTRRILGTHKGGAFLFSEFTLPIIVNRCFIHFLFAELKLLT